MKTLKRLSQIIFFLLIASGCKTTEKSKSKYISFIDSVDRSKIMCNIEVTELLDTVLLISGDSIMMDGLLNSLPVTVIDKGIKMTIDYDKGTGKVSAKSIIFDRKVPVKMAKTTKMSYQKNNNIHVAKNDKVVLSNKKTRPDYLSWVLLFIVGIIILLSAWYILKNNIPLIPIVDRFLKYFRGNR